MTRQLKVSENVHSMLHLFKPSPSTSYDWVLKMLIENAYPALPYRLERINRLYQEDPSEWASEMHDLQQDLLENFVVDFMSRQKERDEEVGSEMAPYWEEDALEQHEREQEEEIERHLAETEGCVVTTLDKAVKTKIKKPKSKSGVKKT
jgi:hypothetical protein